MSYVFSKYNIISEKKNIYYITNTLSGSLIRLDKPMYEILKAQNIDALTEKQQILLYNSGILIDSDVDERALIRAAYKAYCRGRKSVTIIICPTLECNFACPYCFEERQYGKMDSNVENKILCYIEKTINLGFETLKVEWFGGEPLLYPEIIERMSCKIIELCKKKSIEYEFAITTNGYCINEKVLSIFSKIHLTEARITLDGTKVKHDQRRFLKNGNGTFDIIISNIRKLSEQGIKVKIRVNIDKQNMEAYSDVKMELFGMKNVWIYPAIVVEEPTQDEIQKNKCYSIDEYDMFHQMMYRKYCFKPTYEGLFKKGVCSCMAEHDNSCVIDHKGYIYKCVNDVGHPEWAIGNVLSETNFRVPRVVSKYLGRDPVSENPCNSCKFLPLCFGGCVYELKRRKVHDCGRVKYLFEDIVADKLGINMSYYENLN